MRRRLSPGTAIARRRLGVVLRGHPGAVVVLGVGALLRLGVAIAYWPALYFYDSFTYLQRAASGLFLNAYQPAGYPLVIRATRLISHNPGLVTTVQHLAGLLTGALVYLIVWRSSQSKPAATLAAAIVLLDGHLIAVEQYLMTESLFILLLTGSVTAVLLEKRPRAVVASGLLLAVACTLRSSGLFCIPVWLLFVIWRERRSWATLAGVVAVTMPLAFYAAENHAATGRLALTNDTSRVLYARIGSIADCKGYSLSRDERVLCPMPAQLHQSITWYMFDPDSPAIRAFGPAAVRSSDHVDAALSGFATRLMLHAPLHYLGLVGADLARNFIPGAASKEPGELNIPIMLPPRGPALRAPYRYVPAERAPAGVVRSYTNNIYVSQTIVMLLLIAAVLGIIAAPRVGDARPQIGTLVLLVAMATALLLGAALTLGFQLRFELPAVPLFAAAGCTGGASAARWLRLRAVRASGGNRLDE